MKFVIQAAHNGLMILHIGSGNGFVPSDNKSLPGPMLTKYLFRVIYQDVSVFPNLYLSSLYEPQKYNIASCVFFNIANE